MGAQAILAQAFFCRGVQALLPARAKVAIMADGAAAPSEEALQAKAGALKSTETKEAGKVIDPDVKAKYEATFDEHGGDKGKVCAALGLDEAKWADGCTKEQFIAKFLG